MTGGEWHPYGETVKHQRYFAGERDAHGNVRTGYHPGEPVDHVAVEVSTSTETTERGEQVTSWLTLSIPDASVAVGNRDRFEVRGVLYQVVGEPLAEVNPFTGWAPGTVVRVQRVRG